MHAEDGSGVLLKGLSVAALEKVKVSVALLTDFSVPAREKLMVELRPTERRVHDSTNVVALAELADWGRDDFLPDVGRDPTSEDLLLLLCLPSEESVL